MTILETFATKMQRLKFWTKYKKIENNQRNQKKYVFYFEIKINYLFILYFLFAKDFVRNTEKLAYFVVLTMILLFFAVNALIERTQTVKYDL